MNRFYLVSEEDRHGAGGREQEQLRRAQVRLRRIQHYEQITHNVSRTCRFFGISRDQFYFWLRRYRARGVEGLLLVSGLAGRRNYAVHRNARLSDQDRALLRQWALAP